MYRPRRLAALAVLILGMLGAALPLYSRWQDSQEEDRFPSWEKDRFPSLTPDLHYWYALRHLNSRRRDGSVANTSDLNAAILHLEAIPADAREYREAADLLALARDRRDRPEDFPAIEEARFLSCMAEKKAREAERREEVARESPCRHVLTRDGRCITVICMTGRSEQCAPLANYQRLGQLNALLRDR